MTHAKPEQLWRAYRREPTSPARRNALLEIYLHLVRYQAERLHARVPREVDLDDLLAAGLFGLMAAIAAFDPSRHVKFETYACQRIQGAMIDALRNMDWVPRLVRRREAVMRRTIEQLTAELGRPPTDEEIAARLELSAADLDKMRRDGHAVKTVSLLRKWFDTDSDKEVREVHVLADERAPDPVKALQLGELRELVLRGLSGAERLIIILYYFEQLTMKEIGATIGLSESRVSQMHTSLMLRLRAKLARSWPAWAGPGA